ncbi:MAG: NUDIX hydrolase [Candidatus Yanofskybacteria bacterium]|nr:NUDIX hydrolase [Candidatus Yanofskybacteria bacterium]
MRVAGIIIKEGRILLMRRVKNGEEYYVFPGGSVEGGESPEEALEREIKEELNLDIRNYEKVFEIENRGVKEAYYLIMEFSGTLQLGGPEKERMNEQDQYYPEWLELMKAAELKNLFPHEAVAEVKRLPTIHPNPEYFKALPKKRMASGVLMFNDSNELLLVKPSYKDHWSIPGGVVDNNESPREASTRETKEEVNIELEDLKFLCVEYTRKVGDEDLFFLFYGGKLTPEQIKNIKTDPDEVSEFKFAKIEEALKLIGESKILSKILSKYPEILKNNSPMYLENGEKI